ncbi:LOW QUALITY PROTEIN: CDK5 regulatory subunit-associated protein 3 [Porphyrio hochstetteri]
MWPPGIALTRDPRYPWVSPQDYRNVPIDIQTSKLLDWLVDRRHCNLKWQSKVLTIRQKINVAIQDMPENEEIKQLLSGAYLHYFHCLRIVEILKDTELSTKNLFGRYSSQRMKDWQEIVSLYEKENTYLAELASLLVRSISYEIPSLRKQLSRCQQAQQDFARREEECELGAAEQRERFLASCRQYGITGDNVRQELLALVQDLPALLGEIGAGASTLSEPIELYQACVEFVCQSPTELVVPLLRYVGERGNTTVHEWRTGRPPLRLQRPPAGRGAGAARARHAGYVGRVSELLGQKLQRAELLLAKKEALGRRRLEALGEQAALEPRLDRLLRRTRELQRLIEGDISKRYSGRPVNLMGVSV